MSNLEKEGFTLIELILVMALLTVVIAVSMPSLQSFFRGRGLDSEARRFLALSHYGQSRAASEGVPMVLWVDPKNQTYGLQAAPGYWENDPKACQFQIGKQLEIEAVQPTVSAFGSLAIASLSAGQLPAIRFLPDGTIGQSSPVEIQIREGTEIAVRIRQSRNQLRYEIAEETEDLNGVQ